MVDLMGIFDDEGFLGLAENFLSLKQRTAPEAMISRSTLPAPTEGS